MFEENIFLRIGPEVVDGKLGDVLGFRSRLTHHLDVFYLIRRFFVASSTHTFDLVTSTVAMTGVTTHSPEPQMLYGLLFHSLFAHAVSCLFRITV